MLTPSASTSFGFGRTSKTSDCVPLPLTYAASRIMNPISTGKVVGEEDATPRTRSLHFSVSVIA